MRTIKRSFKATAAVKTIFASSYLYTAVILIINSIMAVLSRRCKLNVKSDETTIHWITWESERKIIP